MAKLTLMFPEASRMSSGDGSRCPDQTITTVKQCGRRYSLVKDIFEARSIGIIQMA